MVVMNRVRSRINRRRRNTIIIIVIIAVLAAFLVPYWTEPGIPVFMYHCVADEPRGGDENLYCRPAQIEEQFKYLSDNGYTTLFADEYEQAYSTYKPVILTFDDGYEDNYIELFPLLKKYHMKATIFVVSSYVGTKGYLSEGQLKEMVGSGLVSIQSHTAHHVDLSNEDKSHMDQEFRESCAALAKITGKNVTTISYPGGYFNDKVLNEVQRYFTYAYAIDTNEYSKDNHYEISRGGVYRNTTLESFSMVLRTYSQRRLIREMFKLKHKIFG